MRRAGRHRRDERGFVLLFVAISLVVLLLFSGFAVDLGAWYRESSELQKAADAGALAGVVFMPNDFAQASATAIATVAKNGFVDGVGGITITVSPVVNQPHRLQVCIDDSVVETYFTRIINLHPTLHKCANAEYELPIPMGSPLNEMSSRALNGLDLAINGYCSASEDGDPINSQYTAMFRVPDRTTGYTGCDATTPGFNPPSSPQLNPYYDTNGYTYAVDVKNTSSDLAIQVYDAAYDPASPLDGKQAVAAAPQLMDTTYTVSDGTLTPLVRSDDPVVSTVVAHTGDPTFRGRWVTLYTVPAGANVGVYHIQVTSSHNREAHDLNGFDLRAVPSSQAGNPVAPLCATSNEDPHYDPTCPAQIYAEQHLGVWARGSGTSAQFYLASIDPAYAGHTIVIDLYDPGEGGQTIKLLDPDGNQTTFSYSTPDSAKDASLPYYSGTTNALDVSGTVPLLTGRLNNWKFNDRMVELRVTLPSGYGADGKTWWKLQYDYGSAIVGDRTTWSIDVDGDPVRLVDGR